MKVRYREKTERKNLLAPYQKETDVAIRAVQQAAWLCQNIQKKLGNGYHQKSDRTPVTIADYGSQALICKTLAESFPSDPIVAEESSADLRQEARQPLCKQVLEQVRIFHPQASKSDLLDWIDLGQQAPPARGRFWCLDPIDGTKGFLRGDQYAISLALIENGRVLLGTLACPNLLLPYPEAQQKGAIFLALRSGGAFVTDLYGNTSLRPVRVSTRNEISAARFCESVESGHSSHGDSRRIAQHLKITAPPVRLDSQAKYAMVASGEADIYLRLPTRMDYREKIWDHAAGAILVEEAGGRVTDILGRPLDFSQGRTLALNTGVVASNGAFHDAILQAIQRLKIGR